MMRDILQSRYLRGRVAHKQLARTSLNGHVSICFPPEVRPITRATRLPNTRPFKQISVSNNVCKFSFYLRTITIWNNLPITDDVNLNNFKSIVLAAIKL